MFRTFRHRLLFWFLVFISSSIIIIALSFAYIQQREAIFRNAELVDQSYVLLLKSVKAQQDFFSYETKNSVYFETSISEYLNKYSLLLDSTLTMFNKINMYQDESLKLSIQNQKASILETDSIFYSLVEKIKERGFKDYSLEGAMRDDVHWLENNQLLLTKDVLSLRRHEKDYIIRNEQSYVDKLNVEVDSMKNKISYDKSIDKDTKNAVLNRLNGYQQKFNQLVALDREIGIKDNSGLKRKLDNRISKLEDTFGEVVAATREWSKKAFDRLTVYFGLTVLALLIVSILISALIARNITKPLTELTNHITRFVDSNFTLETDHPVARSRDEIGSLTQNFSVLKDEVVSQMKFFKQKVEERTKELARANERLVKLSEANSRFVPSEFLDYLGKEGIQDVALGDQVEREMTVMFTDIRGFTSISEGLNPQENFDFINSYLKGIVPIIRENGGFIDKFVGDSVMALFPGSPDDAMKATIEFQSFLKEFNVKLRSEDRVPIQMGTGFHSGNLILGTIGHADRLETTVISDAVNTAARVEGLTKHYGAMAIFTGLTLARVINKHSFPYRFLERVRVKGKSNTNSIYELIDPNDQLKLQYQNVYAEALTLLESNDVLGAKKLLDKILQLNPNDKAVKILSDKCIVHLESNAEIWLSETNMISKK